LKNIFGAVNISHNLWHDFEYYELTINQRQIDDPKFGQMLERIRIGNPNENDISELEKRVIENYTGKNRIETAVDFYFDNYQKYEDSLYALFPTTDSVNMFNEIISTKLGK